MASLDYSMVLLLLGVTAVLYALCEYFLVVKHDAKEPPLIPQYVPYIGHALSMIRQGSDYYSKISARYPLPIYTLAVPRSKIYVVNSPDLVAAAERNSKTISFAPYVVLFAQRVLLPSKQAEDALAENLNGERGDWGCRIETFKAMHLALSPGVHLDDMNKNLLGSVCQLLDVSGAENARRPVELFSWTRHVISLAVTEALYGPGNPFRDREVEMGFWAMDKNFAPLLLNTASDLICRKAYRGREKVFKGFLKYFAAGNHTRGSRLVQARYEVNNKYGMSVDDIARFELAPAIASLVNTAPAAFWMLIHIYSSPSLLDDLRQKLSAFVTVSSASSGVSTTPSIVQNLDMTEIIKDCPLLMSLLQEVLRLQSTNAAGRMVLEDTMLSHKYLLRKGSMLLIPAAELHNKSSVWGPSVDDFDPYRFVENTEQGKSKIPASAYRAFGGGSALCPGRYFAAMGVLSVVVPLILEYDITPVDGQWVMPKSHPHILTSLLSPDKDTKVWLHDRKEGEIDSWNFTLSGSVSRPEPSAMLDTE